MVKTWVPVPEGSDFPIQNLPFGVFSTSSLIKPRIGVAIGDLILDLAAASRLEPLAGTRGAQLSVFDRDGLNEFMNLGKDEWSVVREAITSILSESNPVLRDNKDLQQDLLIPMDNATMHLPAHIGDYTDFYACQEHARNAAGIKTGVRILTANWLHMPVAYHSRSSSVVVSGTPVHRPVGQAATNPARSGILKYFYNWWSAAYPVPREQPSKALDYELEMGLFVGTGNKFGEGIPADEAEDHIFGAVLLNDWSARDFQKFEMFPLGPFNGKNFATSISPWVVTMEALKEFKKAAGEQTPAVLPYLNEKGRSLYDINLTATIVTEDGTSSIVSRSNAQQLYWTPQQMIAHHTVGGCNLRPGDLLGTGTISSPGEGGQGCLLELSWGGTRPVQLEGSQQRTYLKDGDTVTLRGRCQAEGYHIGFGNCEGKVLPAQKG